MSEIDQIIRRMILACGVKNQTQMLDMCGFANSAASIWKRRGEVPDGNIAKVHEKTGVSFAWLKHGIGQMRPDPVPPRPEALANVVAEAKAEYNNKPLQLSRDEYALVKFYRRLNEEGKDMLIDMADTLEETHKAD